MATKSFAANLDQLLVLVAGEPMFSESQLARAFIAARDAGIPALVVLNKIDLPAADAARERLAPYRAHGGRAGRGVVEGTRATKRIAAAGAAPARPRDAGARARAAWARAP